MDVNGGVGALRDRQGLSHGPPCVCVGAPLELVRLHEIDPRLRIELRYATSRNLTGRVIYRSPEAWLRRSTAAKLVHALDLLRPHRLGIKVLDAYRPPSAQAVLWSACPDPAFVAPPERGSRHTRGTTVDVTLVDAVGAEVEMPSAYDAFSERARRDWPGASAAARRHADLLAAVMVQAGFEALDTEWWHFDDVDWRTCPLLDWEPEAAVGAMPVPGVGVRGGPDAAFATREALGDPGAGRVGS